MKILFNIILLSLTFLSCNSTTVTKSPYEEDDNFKIFIPVTIKGKTFKFLFDTGTNETTINYATASRVNIISTNQRLCELHSPDTFFIDSVYYVNCELSIQGMKFSTSVLCLDKYNVSFSKSVNYEGYDGVLGNRDIKKKSWLFDFKNKCFTLSDKTVNLSSFIEEQAQVLELKINNNYSNLYVDICLEDSVRHTFLFDTGWSKRIELNYEGDDYIFYSDFAFRDSFVRYLTDRIYFPKQSVLLQTIKINGMLVKGLTADINSSNIIKENIIAAPFLRRFRYMLYDSNNQTISLFCAEDEYDYKGNEEKKLIDRIVKRFMQEESTDY